jgi:hypothetical protein
MAEQLTLNQRVEGSSPSGLTIPSRKSTGPSPVPDNAWVTATDVTLPAGSILLHIGPHKTGTTSVQSAFHAARRALAAHGVVYAGPDRHAVGAAQAAIETAGPGVRRVHPVRPWRELLREIGRAGDERVVLSSEWFADAELDAIRRIVGELGSDRVHVVVTLRSLARILPSQWQQYVAAGSTIGYAPWLESVFADSGEGDARSFWHRHRHDRLVGRWAEVVGPGNVSVVVVDDHDREVVLRAFEGLIGVPAGTLVAEPERQNRSFTVAETDLLRTLNAALARAVDDPNLRLNLGLYGSAAAMRLREPGASEPRIQTPAWAAQRAAGAQREIVDGIERQGVRVVGDLGTLATRTSRPMPERDGPAREDAAWPDVVAAAGVGALAATGLARGTRSGELAPLSTERLARVAYQRFRDGLRLRVRSIGRRRTAATASDTDGRWLTPIERVALDRFRAAVAAEGVPATLADRVAREGIIPELRRSADGSPEVPERAWPEIGTALVMGVIRASGLLGAGEGGRRRPPPRARIETLEVARVSTPIVALVVLRRLLAGVPGRLITRAGS